MAFEPGYKTRVLAGQYDLSTYLKGTSVERQRDNIDVTAFQPDAATPVYSYIAGLPSGSLILEGMFDPDTGASDEVVASMMDGSLQVVTVSHQGANTIGDRVQILNGIQISAPIESSIDDSVLITAGRQGSAAVKGGVVLHPHVARASAANYTSVDNAAATSGGAAANLHVVAFTGTSAVVKVTDSTDDATFADLVTFATVTGATSERATAAGTVNRYSRVQLSGTFTTITFTVGFARL